MSVSVSVIVPVYNVEQYLNKCAESIEGQSFPDFEIILVDDGSSDGSGAICDGLGNRYSNIKVIHQNNSGVSSARNRGLDAAEGKYVVFCDSDDYVARTMLEELINAKEDYPARLPVCGIRKYSSSKVTDWILDGGARISVEKKDFFILQKAQLFNSPVNKLFEKSVIDNYNLRFNAGITLGEDLGFNADYVMKSGCDFIVINKPLYYYNDFAADSLCKKYIPDILENYTALDRKFRELIEFTGADMTVYGKRLAEINLYSVINSIKNTMSEKNVSSKSGKIKQIKQILEAFDVRDIVSKADTTPYSPVYLKILCTGNAGLIYSYISLRK